MIIKIHYYNLQVHFEKCRKQMHRYRIWKVCNYNSGRNFCTHNPIAHGSSVKYSAKYHLVQVTVCIRHSY